VNINRWWHAAIATSLVACAALLLWGADTAADVTLGLGVIAFYALCWVAIAPRAREGNRAAHLLIAATVVTAFVGSVAEPNFAFFQCVAYPLVWVLSASKRRAIIASACVATAIGSGFFIGGPFTGQWLGASVLTALLSLGFSIAFGLWIAHIAELGDERQVLLDELQATQSELVALSREAGVVGERERLARDIHDTVAQDLAGLVMLAEQARRTNEPDARDALLAQVVEGARGALQETRALVAAGSPSSLDAGLAAAIGRVAERFTRDTGISVSVDSTRAIQLERDAEVVLLRCAQEALTNIRRHSGAATAHLELDGTTLRVRDDGHGFDPHSPTPGVGLAGMRERVGLVGGRLDIASGPDGTVLTVSLAPAVDTVEAP
jgi:signal transduction histidine kinase